MTGARDTVWLAPPAKLRLPDDEAHVWRATLDLPESDAARCRRLLAADEVERAARFYFERDRKRYAVGRGLLRLILGRYLEVAPEELRFDYNRHGRPALAAPFARHGLFFNLSHAEGLALYAVARRAIGVDLERVRPDFEHEKLVQRFFSPQEAAEFAALPAAAKPQAFFDCWTRKEAYIKAHGRGLSMPLDSFDVSLTPGRPAQLLATRDNPAEASQWTLIDLSPQEGYAGALAVKGKIWKLKQWRVDAHGSLLWNENQCVKRET